MSIRNAAKAIIIHNGKMLLNKNRNSLGDMCYGLPNGAIYYDLPGGGQNQYETLEEAVQRECLEESGYTVAVDRLATIYEEISVNNKFRTAFEEYAHKVHFVFICHVVNKPIQPLAEKDLDMLESVWVDVGDVDNMPLYPVMINSMLDLILKSETPLYLGSERIS